MARWAAGSEGRLKQVAMDLFLQRGFDDVTVGEIAEAAGVTERTFFRYFADKREVLFVDQAAYHAQPPTTATSRRERRRWPHRQGRRRARSSSLRNAVPCRVPVNG